MSQRLEGKCGHHRGGQRHWCGDSKTAWSRALRRAGRHSGRREEGPLRHWVGQAMHFPPASRWRPSEGLVEAAVSELGRSTSCSGAPASWEQQGNVDVPAGGATIDIMVHGVFYGMKHASRHMKEAGTGSIISMSSTAGVMGGLGPHAYTAAKHAVVGMTRNLAAEVGGFGVRVNCIAPAGMATPMVADVMTGDHSKLDETIAALAEASPLKGRAGLAQDVANAALWLGSDESGYTSGMTLTVDAGYTTGSRVEPPAFAEYQPMIREAGRSGID